MNQYQRVKLIVQEVVQLKKKDRIEEARSLLEEALEEFPENNFLRVSLADLLLRLNRPGEAEVLVEQILKEDPVDYRAWLVKGDLAYQKRNYQQAGQFHLQAYQLKKDLNRFSFSNFASIKAISYGEIIAEEFQEVLKECSLIPARFKKRSFSLLLQHQIWNYLVQRKGELKDELTELKGKLNQLSNADDFKSFNLERFYKYTEQLAELLTEIKVSYNSGEGLERFAAAYRSFPHLDQYLHRLAQLKDFLNNYWSSYRKIKQYLHHPALKIGGGKNDHALPSLYHNLLQSLQDDSVLLEDGFMDSLLRGFAGFQQLYIDYYWTAHQKEVAEERFLAYHKIREARDYRVLSLLAGIRMISVKDDLVKVDRMITRVLGKQCNLSNSEHLQLLPICSCGSVPGQKIALTPVKVIRQTIEQGILQYLQALKSEQFGEKINSYLEKMKAVGEKRFARPIRELLLLEVGTDLVGELEQRLNGNVIKKINRALAGDITVVERDIDHLIENLVARSFSPEQIKNIFKEWLEGSEGLAEGSYIKIISEHNGLGKGQTGQVLLPVTLLLWILAETRRGVLSNIILLMKRSIPQKLIIYHLSKK